MIIHIWQPHYEVHWNKSEAGRGAHTIVTNWKLFEAHYLYPQLQDDQPTVFQSLLVFAWESMSASNESNEPNRMHRISVHYKSEEMICTVCFRPLSVNYS